MLVSGVRGGDGRRRRFGAPFRSVLLVLPVCVVMVTPLARERTQAFIVPLFMAPGLPPLARQPQALATGVLVPADPGPVGQPHGTVTMGAGLVGLHGATILWQRRRHAFYTRRGSGCARWR